MPPKDRSTIVYVIVCSLKELYTLKYAELKFCLLFFIGVNLGLSY